MTEAALTLTWQMGFVFAVASAAVLLFATEKLPTDVVAVLVMVALLLSGILTPEEGLAGFANGATVTVGAMFIVGAAVFRTGAVSFLGVLLERLARRSLTLTLATLMVGVAVLSAFLNNTAAVAVLIPVVLSVARATKTSASKLLMPLSFASIMGGMCTLIGTSTNILGASIAARHGQPPLGMFEFSGVGVLLTAAGVLYLLFVGVRLIPDRRKPEGLVESFEMTDYLTEVVLLPEAKSVGMKVAEAALFKETDAELVELVRAGRVFPVGPRTVLLEGDLLRLTCSLTTLVQLQEREGVKLTGSRIGTAELEAEENVLLEAVVAPNAALIGRSLAEVRFRQKYGGVVLALRHRGALMRGRLEHLRLRAGDALLISIPKDQQENLQANPAFVVVSQPNLPSFRRKRMALTLVIVAAVIASASLGLFPIVVGAVAGAVLLIITGCLDADEAYQAVEWRVLVLLAGLLSLGLAMEKTGAARLIANQLVALVGDFGPVAVLAAIFLLTMVLTEVMSNNATVALLMPIAMVTARSLGVSPRPYLFTVLFAASSSFMTPVGFQTNTMVYAPGRYHFTDFLKVGVPLKLLFWGLATLLIPLVWPF